ncbi:MAG: DUF2269 family protein [Acidimicrobiales bacterium]|jgi:hypothetical protein
MPAPLYDILLILHIASALIGFGSIAVGGVAASAGRRSGDPACEERVVRFFREGTDWPGRVIFVVPVIGLVMLLGGDHADIGHAWPWLGLGLWFVASGLASGLGWPAERRAQRELAAIRSGDSGSSASFTEACARMEQAAALVSVCFVLVVALMIWQP